MRLVLECAAAGVLVAALVLAATALKGDEYRARVGLLAGPATPEAPQYGEVTALGLPALVELARSPSVLARTGVEAERVTVELVPASGLARLTVRAPSASQAVVEATAVARAVVEADLLAPAAKLRVLDQPDVARVSPDWPLALGLALLAGAVAGVALAVVRHLRRTRVDDAVRVALSASGVRHPVPVLADDAPDLVAKLTALLDAAARPARVVAVDPALTGRAEELATRLPDKAFEPGDGVALVAVAPRAGRHEALAGAVGVLPPGTAVVAVVLA
ncbi:hypothetical protein KZQ38_32705 [Saccharothrix sp. SC076]|nr:hypothetical protein [Saccharothrix obliqua]